MNKDSIDKIFSEGLNTPMKFTNNEQQWKVVNKKLNKSKKRYFFWIWLLGISFAVVFSALIIDNNNTESEIQHSTNIDLDSQNMNANTGINYENIKNQETNTSTQTKASSNTSKTTTPVNINNESILNTSALSQDRSNKTQDAPIRMNKTAKENQGLNSGTESIKNSNPSIYNAYGKNNNTTSINDLQTTPLNINKPTDKIPFLPLIIPSEIRRENYSKIENKEVFTSVPSQKKKVAFSIKIGAMTDFLGLDIVSDTREYSPYFGVGVYLFDKVNISTVYSSRNIDRVITKNHMKYNVPAEPNIYQPEIADTTNIEYSNKSIDFNIDYAIVGNRFFQLSARFGAQLNKNESHNLVYIYNTPYSTIKEELIANKQQWHLSDLTTGLSVAIPFGPRVRVDSGYQYHWSVANTNYKWSNRHRISLGINYIINL